ncbi:MAG: adenylate/guanylate cyclase domain-containing protein, partial [Deltaproteobacteria bacterium]
HRDLRAVADDHVQDARHAFQMEFDNGLADLTAAARVIVADPDTHHALLTHDARDAIDLAHIFARIYPRMDILLATSDGGILADVGPSAVPALLSDIAGLPALPRDREFHAILPNGCGSAHIHQPPARAVTLAVGDVGWVLVCEPLDQAYLEVIGRQVGMQVALFDGARGTELSDATSHFPRMALTAATTTSSLIEPGSEVWAIVRFTPTLPDNSQGAHLAAIAAVDVTGISRGVHRNLYATLGLVLFAALVSLLVGVRVAGGMSRALQTVIGGFRKLEKNEYVHVPVGNTRDELEWLATGFNHMVEGLVERDKLRSTFGKYMTESVLEHLLAGKVALGGETLTVTVLFSDIRSFTSISERMDAQALVRLLNEYFTEMVSIVMEHDGVVDKYIGDAIMAVFGAPVMRPEDAVNAVRAAVAMRKSLARLNERLAARGDPPLRTGIGLHTGEVVAGNIGSEQRMEYTVIGDAVNLASRLESATKELGIEILMSATTYELVKSEIDAKPVDEIKVKGRDQAVMVYGIGDVP